MTKHMTAVLCVALAGLYLAGCSAEDEQQDPTCSDQVMNGDETDVDCGGTDCPPCEDGLACLADEDCVSGLCEEETCAPDQAEVSCENEVKDGLETDVDCGGPDCPPCADGSACLVNQDCASGVCREDTCAAEQVEVSCENEVQDGLETDVDCGGSECPPCADGSACLADEDCASGSCLEETCAPEVSCENGIKDGSETDVDCGGPDCPECVNGFACLVQEDCDWMNCENGVCGGYNTCQDQQMNGHETDIDCGGPICHGCPAGKICLVDSDCLSGACEGGMCTEPDTSTCDNGIRDGNETDVDCGGGLCDDCPDGYACETLQDCGQAPYCGDGMCGGHFVCENLIQDGHETDVDCGGLCSPCDGGKSCVENDDCLSELCEDGVCAERALTCDNDVMDGRETDVDCGASCDPCQEGQGCLLPRDCATLACMEGTCGTNLLSLQSDPAGMSCLVSGEIVMEQGVSLAELVVASWKFDVDEDRVGFWVQQSSDAWLAPDDGRFAGIFVVADRALAADVDEFVEVELTGDWIEKDCHSEIHVGPEDSLTTSMSMGLWPMMSHPELEVLMDGGSEQQSEPYEGVYVTFERLEVTNVDGYDGPVGPGNPQWWFELGGGIKAADDFDLRTMEHVELGETVSVSGYVVQRQGVYLLAVKTVSRDAFGW